MFQKNDFENLKKLESILLLLFFLFYKNLMLEQRILPF